MDLSWGEEIKKFPKEIYWLSFMLKRGSRL